MSVEIGVGSVVECVSTNRSKNHYRVGSVYRVGRIRLANERCHKCGFLGYEEALWMVGNDIPCDEHRHGSAAAKHFRPIGGDATTIADLIRIGSERKVRA